MFRSISGCFQYKKMVTKIPPKIRTSGPPPAIAVNVFRFLHTPLSTLTTHTHTHTQTNTEKYKFQLFPICFVFRPQIAFNESCGRFGRLRVPSSFVLLLLLLFRFFLRLVSFLYSFCVCRCLARRPLRPPRPSPAQYVQKGGATNNSRSTQKKILGGGGEIAKKNKKQNKHSVNE